MIADSVQGWLTIFFQAVTALGVAVGLPVTYRASVAARHEARGAKAAAIDSTAAIVSVGAKVEGVHLEMNSMKDALVDAEKRASDAAGEKRGIAIGKSQAGTQS
jgi:hypothetical protein